MPTTHTRPNRWRFAVDRGGTFTDVVGIDPAGEIRTAKLPSRSPAYEDAAIEGVRRLLGVPADRALPAERVEWIRLGTTVATNALLERTGTPTGLLITRGFADLLEIGNQQRPDLFALAIRKPELLYCAVAEVDERIGPDGAIETPARAEQIEQALAELAAAGAESIAIVFLHAWKNPSHELLAERIAREAGFGQVSTSHRALSVIQVVGRGRTTLVDAYLTPILMRYAERVRAATGNIPLHFMSSAGGLATPGRFTGKDAILSGPAGGVLGTATVAELCGDPAVIGFDMGGTSTDVCRYAGTLERVLEATTGGIQFQAPMLHVETVAAGGGSRLDYAYGRLTVGPESAGADPGPACYGLGGPATITDANLVLGRLIPEHFPRVFGPGRDAPLDVTASRQRLGAIAERVGKDVEAVALGFVRIANEAMSRPIKALSVARGFDLRRHALVTYGGAGAQHACGLAASLGIETIRIHPLAGLLSAYGIARARHRRQHVETVLVRVDAASLSTLAGRVADIAEGLIDELVGELGRARSCFATAVLIGLRTVGTDTPLIVPFTDELARLTERFDEAHRRRYGFAPDMDALEIVHLEVEAVEVVEPITPPVAAAERPAPPPLSTQAVWFDEAGPIRLPVYRLDGLAPGVRLAGPAIVVDAHSTIVVEPEFDAEVDAAGVLTIRLRRRRVEAESTRLDPITLELFNHRFMGIAGRMGETLARTAHSVNIKERRDFSCAIFDAHGRLIANAPHVPVHLGAMGETVANLIDTVGAEIREGDVYVSNDPHAGGSHLPDVTVVSPVFRAGSPAFYVASRGHHADIGGTVPGSMPPDAERLEEEGVRLANLLAVRGGRLMRDAVVAAFSAGPYPARNLPERLSDLQAQIAANQVGLGELGGLCDLHGDAVVSAYMDHMRENAAAVMREALAGLLAGRERWSGRFEDGLDGGERIRVLVRIGRDAAGRPRAEVDFVGTSGPSRGNLNAPRAVVRAAVLYCFRTLIRRDIPLNDGCLEPIDLSIPPVSLLDPPPNAAVAGGNVETSQRIVDVLYGALGVAAASQGTMNNLLFGTIDGGPEAGQYYETIAGGAGASAGASGASGVQVHMTNTRITDPEVLEHRFPWVRLVRFTLRRGSGGAGAWRGGDGVVRALRFERPVMLTLLCERRQSAPFGLAGGGPGAPGIDTLIAPDGTRSPLPGRYQGRIDAGWTVEIQTPGGGGFGDPVGEGDAD